MTAPLYSGKEGRLILCKPAELQAHPEGILQCLELSVICRLPLSREDADILCGLAPLLCQVGQHTRYTHLDGLLRAITLEELLRFAPVLAAAIPELAPTLGFDQCSPHHKYDLFTHTAHVVAQVPGEPVLRWAALLHDVGKPAAFTRDSSGRGHFKGHALKGAPMAEAILTRMQAPKALREEVVRLIALHMTRLRPEEALLRQYLTLYGSDTLRRLLLLQQADMNSKGIPGEEQTELFQETARMLQAMA